MGDYMVAVWLTFWSGMVVRTWREYGMGVDDGDKSYLVGIVHGSYLNIIMLAKQGDMCDRN